MILHGEYIVTEQFKMLWQIAPSNVEENNPWLCPIPTITKYRLHLILLQEMECSCCMCYYHLIICQFIYYVNEVVSYI